MSVPEAIETPKELEMECEQIDISALDVSDEVRCWCGKCKDFRLHRVKGLIPDKPPSSVCLTCSAVHRVRLYRPGSRTKAKRAPAPPPANPWIAAVRGASIEDATAYSMSGSYERNEVVNHKAFGLGKVTDVIGPSKVRIVFEEGSKVMLQNR